MYLRQVSGRGHEPKNRLVQHLTLEKQGFIEHRDDALSSRHAKCRAIVALREKKKHCVNKRFK